MKNSIKQQLFKTTFIGLFLILAIGFSSPIFGQHLSNTSTIAITKTWSQEPLGYTYPMDIYVPTSAEPVDGFPVCINLHGNGGVGNVNAWKDVLPNHIIVAPSGYERSWNIADENSKAPDVEMIGELIAALQAYANVNPNKIRILGTSNGAALANRVLIENNDRGVDIICAVVSHLTEASYHNGGFYLPSGETGDDGTGTPPFEGYDTPVLPINNRRYLNISNTNDGIIPYTGGPSPVGTTFISAQEAAYRIAQSQGYMGSQLTDSTQIGSANVYEFEYLNGQVVHLQGDAMHTTNTTQKEYIQAYFNEAIEMDTISSCTTENAPCNDGNPRTILDRYDSNCDCIGEPFRYFANLLLEGFYDASSGNMRTDLNVNNLLPFNQPYNNAPWFYEGEETIGTIPPTIVDWVLIVSRDASGNVLAMKAGLVDEQGQLVGTDLRRGIEFEEAYNTFLSIHHRSHLAILSASPYIGGTQNFTHLPNLAKGETALKLVAEKYMMYAGDYNGSGIINSLDFNLWKTQKSTLNQYLSMDGDGNGIINSLDYNLWKQNSAQLTDQSIWF